MVILSQLLRCAKETARKKHKHTFIDSLRINVIGGSGGHGLSRYGGKGGSGGDVNIIAKKGLDLKKVRDRLKNGEARAEPGGNSTRNGIIGMAGADKDIKVPLGITVYTENGTLLGELNENGSKLTAARGGLGGCKGTGYNGIKGESRTIILDLKLIADVGLIGFPNAGKSTLLSLISAAKPKIANYAFTTLKPQLGILQYPDYRTISVADLPGLIEGAHANIGMGHKFLKHVERTKMLLFVADIQGFQLGPTYPYRNCLETIVLLNKEIELYKPDLLNMPAMLLINKLDTKDADNIYKDLELQLNDFSTFVSSCPEEIQPEKIIQFDVILKASLIKNVKEEIESIKNQIREILDNEKEKQILEANGNIHAEELLLKKIRQQTRQNVPTLI